MNLSLVAEGEGSHAGRFRRRPRSQAQGEEGEEASLIVLSIGKKKSHVLTLKERTSSPKEVGGSSPTLPIKKGRGRKELAVSPKGFTSFIFPSKECISSSRRRERKEGERGEESPSAVLLYHRPMSRKRSPPPAPSTRSRQKSKA